jgi:single-stranded-DNA-specific exonuclease
MAVHSRWIPRRNEIEAAPTGDGLVSLHGQLLGQTLWSRGLEDPTLAQSYLNPSLSQLKSPFTLLNLRESAERLADAIEASEALCVYADYDMDGMSGLALLYSFLQACGVKKVCHFQPHRFEQGYGLHASALEDLAEKGVHVVVTVDTGTTALEAAKRARELGLSLIITDHHQVGETLPDTPWLINPNQPADKSGLGYLSGAGTAFYLCMGLRALLRERGYFARTQLAEPDLRLWLDLFVLGTVGDVVELKGDNRALVRAGLEQLRASRRTGLRRLVEQCFADAPRISARDVGFSIVPKLNAASRMGQAELSTRLLLCDDDAEATQLVESIVQLNVQRTEIQAGVLAEALEQAVLQMDAFEGGPRVLVVAGPWHEGVLGIVAAKLADRFARPAIVLAHIEAAPGASESVLRGSMRVRGPAHCVSLLARASELLRRFGGHQAAAGMELLAGNLEALRLRLHQAATELYGAEHWEEEVFFDGELANSTSLDEILKLDRMAPWGAGNPEPLFLLRQVPLERLGFLKETHVKGKTAWGQELIGFHRAADLRAAKSAGATHVDVLATPEINTFRNQANVQLRIERLRASQEA